jgi:hypothetical protein
MCHAPSSAVAVHSVFWRCANLLLLLVLLLSGAAFAAAVLHSGHVLGLRQ